MRATEQDGIDLAIAIVTLQREDRFSEITAMLLDADQQLLRLGLSAAARMLMNTTTPELLRDWAVRSQATKP